MIKSSRLSLATFSSLVLDDSCLLFTLRVVFGFNSAEIIETSRKSISFVMSDVIRVAVVQFMIWFFCTAFSVLPASDLFLFSQPSLRQEC